MPNKQIPYSGKLSHSVTYYPEKEEIFLNGFDFTSSYPDWNPQYLTSAEVTPSTWTRLVNLAKSGGSHWEEEEEGDERFLIYEWENHKTF